MHLQTFALIIVFFSIDIPQLLCKILGVNKVHYGLCEMVNRGT